MTIREQVTSMIAELDSKYRRVPMLSVIDLTNDSTSDIKDKLEENPTGKYEHVGFYYLDFDDLDQSDFNDDNVDEAYDEFETIATELLGKALWLIPVTDPKFSEQNSGLYLTKAK